MYLILVAIILIVLMFALSCFHKYEKNLLIIEEPGPEKFSSEELKTLYEKIKRDEKEWRWLAVLKFFNIKMNYSAVYCDFLNEEDCEPRCEEIHIEYFSKNERALLWIDKYQAGWAHCAENIKDSTCGEISPIELCAIIAILVDNRPEWPEIEEVSEAGL